MLVTVHENDSAGNTQMDLRHLPICVLEDYHRKCAGLVDVKRFNAMSDNGKNLVMFDQNRFERDTALGGWKWR